MSAIIFIVWRCTQRRFSDLDDSGQEIKWPELQPEGQTISAQASTLNPLGTRRTGGAGIEMGEKEGEWNDNTRGEEYEGLTYDASDRNSNAAGDYCKFQLCFMFLASLTVDLTQMILILAPQQRHTHHPRISTHLLRLLLDLIPPRVNPTKPIHTRLPNLKTTIKTTIKTSLLSLTRTLTPAHKIFTPPQTLVIQLRVDR